MRAPIQVSLSTLAIAAVLAVSSISPANAADVPSDKPTIVLVHGAFAESASWDGVISRLLVKGYSVFAVANPLRGVKSDAQEVATVVDSIPGPVVLVGHSYGGSVISNVTAAKGNIKALVFVSAFAPDGGESALELTGKLPGSTLGSALAPAVPLPGGGTDLYIQQPRFHDQFAADVPSAQAELMAVTQRPITKAALDEPSGQPAWKTTPSYFVYGSLDKNIPPALQPFMAERAHAKKVVEVPGASHVVMVSHPAEVARLIEDAANQHQP